MKTRIIFVWIVIWCLFASYCPTPLYSRSNWNIIYESELNIDYIKRNYSHPTYIYYANSVGLFLTTDFGKNSKRLGTLSMPLCMEAYEDNVYAGFVGSNTYHERGLYFSNDRGNSFSLITSRLNDLLGSIALCPYDIAFCYMQPQRTIFLAHCYGLSVTHDSGRNWSTLQHKTSNIIHPFYAVANSPVDTSQVYAFTIEEYSGNIGEKMKIYLSRNSGHSFSARFEHQFKDLKQMSDSQMIVHPANANFCLLNLNLVFEWGKPENYQFITTNGGSTWSILKNPVPGVNLRSLMYSIKHEAILAVSNNGIYKLDHLSQIWRQIHQMSELDFLDRDRTLIGLSEVGVNDEYFLVASSQKRIYMESSFSDTAPILKAHPQEFNLRIEANTETNVTLQLWNDGQSQLSGTLSTNTSWIRLSPTSFTNDATITVTLSSRGLSVGTHWGSIEIKSNGGNKTIPVSLTVFKQDTSPPVLSISSPRNNERTSDRQILVEGRASDPESGIASLELNYHELYVDDDGYFEYYYDLELGKNSLLLVATNGAGLITDRELIVYRDTPDSKPPTLTVYSPTPGQKVYEDTVLVHGKATDEDSGLARVTVNGREVSVDRSGEFKTTVPLSMGKNTLKVEAWDHAGNTTSQSLEVIREDQRLIIIELWIGNRIALVDREPVPLDTPPIIHQSRTMVPVRFIAEAFGADIFYDAREQEINIAFGPTYISLWINRTRARVETVENGERVNRIVTLDAPPIIRSGRTLVPVRFIAEAFGATIDWNAREEKITIELLVARSASGAPPPDRSPSPDESVNTRGNTLGNIVNSGLVAQQGEWIY